MKQWLWSIWVIIIPDSDLIMPVVEDGELVFAYRTMINSFFQLSRFETRIALFQRQIAGTGTTKLLERNPMVMKQQVNRLVNQWEGEYHRHQKTDK